MKYKVITLIASLILVCSTFVAAIYPSAPENYGANRYHQHMEAQEKESCNHADDSFCTHLPLVSINTGGQEIPGHKYYDENGNSQTVMTPDGKDYIVASIDVFDSAEKNNHLTDASSIASSMRISVRGRSSRYFDKSGYSITLIDENGENNAQEMMGMDSHHEWVIHGPFLDKTLIRNYMWYNISGSIMSYAPNVRFFELFIDGEYMGVYLMVESITAGKDSRLNLSVSKKNNTFSGYCLRLDQGSSTEIKNMDTFSMYMGMHDLSYNIVYPGTSNLNETLRRNIELDFSKFEKSLHSYDFKNSIYGYKKSIDVNSFVDYFIINEITCNYDAGALSTYIYRDMSGLYKMCVWDFNSSCDNYFNPIDIETFSTQDSIIYIMLIRDPDFTEKIVERYRELRKTILSEEYLMNYIDNTIAYLGDAVDRNYEKWGYSFDESEDLITPTENNPRSYEEAVSNMKNFITNRGNWLDANIEAIYQYSSDSKNAKNNEGTD